MRKEKTEHPLKNWHRLLKLMITMVILTIVQFQSKAQVDTNAKIKSLFIYNFSKYIEWPADMKEGNFVIGIYGDYPKLTEELKRMSSSRKRGDQTFEITNYDGINNMNKCHILYVVAANSEKISSVIKEISGKNILLVTEGAGLAKQGAGISFFDANNKQRMEINPNNVEKSKLKISSQLLALATVVK